MKIRTVIVDDEYLARERLKGLLSTDKDIVIVGEGRDGSSAISEITEKRPDLLFLDIQMPDMDGFDVVKRLTMPQLPHIIFSTAHDQFAIDAFRISALDYLLKPFDEERLLQAVAKAKRQISLELSDSFEKKLRQLVRSYEAESSDYLEMFEIKEKGLVKRIQAEDILYIAAEGNYVKLATDDHSYLYRSSLHQILSQIDQRAFLRIHRSIIINTNHMTGRKYLGNNEFRFELRGGIKLDSSRSYKDNIQEFFS